MTAVHAAGLGRLNVISTVGQPLQAEVELIDVNPEDAKSIKAKVGSKEAYNAAGLKNGNLDDVNIEVKQKTNGTHYLSISSNKPVNESFLNLLIEAESSSGKKLTRDYSVLLDPNTQNSKKKRVTQQAVNDEENEPETTSKKTQARKTKKTSTQTNKGEAYRVKSGDTLSQIALQNKAVELSLDQMLVVLYENNRNAFVNNNMNNLKSGVIIRIPKEGEVKKPSRQAAKREVRLQAEDWHGYRQKVASSVLTKRDAQKGTPQESLSDRGRITPKVTDAQNKPKGDILKLSGPGAGQGKNDPQQVNALQEDNVVKEKALREANERIQLLQRNLEEMRKLLVLRNQELAKMQEQAKPHHETSSAPADQPEKQPEANKDFISKLTSDPIYLGGGAAAILAGLGLFFLLRKRKKEKEEAERKRKEAQRKRQSELKDDFENDFDKPNRMADEGFKPVALGKEARKLDILTEVDILCSNSHYNEAIQKLKDEIARSPRNFRLYHKLLELYKDYQKDTASFEREARVLLEMLNNHRDDPNWKIAAKMGQVFDPLNPLYQDDFSAPNAISNALQAEDKFDKTIEINSKDFADLSSLDNDISIEAVALPDFDASQSKGKKVAPPATNNDFDDLTLSNFAGTPAPQPVSKAPAAASSDDFDFEDLLRETPNSSGSTQTNAKTENTDFSSDFDDLDSIVSDPKPKVDVTKKEDLSTSSFESTLEAFSKPEKTTPSLDDTMNSVYNDLKDAPLHPEQTPEVDTILGDMHQALQGNSDHDDFADIPEFNTPLDMTVNQNKNTPFNENNLDLNADDFDFSGEKKPDVAATINTSEFNNNLMIAAGDIDMREYENAKKLLLPILEYGTQDQKEMAQELMDKIPSKNK